jgi:hypothetical protein
MIILPYQAEVSKLSVTDECRERLHRDLFRRLQPERQEPLIHMRGGFSLTRPSYHGIALGSGPQRLCLFFQS